MSVFSFQLGRLIGLPGARQTDKRLRSPPGIVSDAVSPETGYAILHSASSVGGTVDAAG